MSSSSSAAAHGGISGIIHRLDDNQRELADLLDRAERHQAPPVSNGVVAGAPFRQQTTITTTTSNPLLFGDNDAYGGGGVHSSMTSSGSVSSFLDEDTTAPMSVTIAENRLRRDGCVEHIERHLSLDDLSKEMRGNTVYSDKSKMWKLNRRVRRSNQHLDQLALEKSPSKIAINIQPATPVSPGGPSDMFTFEPATPTPKGLGQVTTESLRNLLDPKAHGFGGDPEHDGDDGDDDDDDEEEEKRAGSDDVESNYSSAGEEEDDEDVDDAAAAAAAAELDNSLQRNRNDVGFGEFREHSVQDAMAQPVVGHASPPSAARDRSHSVPSADTHEMKVFDQRRPVEMDVFKQGCNDNDDDATELMDIGVRARNELRYAALASLKQRIDGFHQQVVSEIDMLTQQQPQQQGQHR